MEIGIVNDMQTSLITLHYITKQEMGWQVIWQAENGLQAVNACARQRPDLIFMDLMMPVMDGVESIRQIMSKYPCPILIVMAGIEKDSAQLFAALSAGAIDAVDMPGMSKEAIDAFVNKLHMVEKQIEFERGIIDAPE